MPAPQPTTVAAGKVEVDEVFWYGCGHCYALDPALESWKADKAAVRGIRARSGDLGTGRTGSTPSSIYTLQALHRPELHAKVFDAIHQQGLPLSARDEVEARAMQFAFLNRAGRDGKGFRRGLRLDVGGDQHAARRGI